MWTVEVIHQIDKRPELKCEKCGGIKFIKLVGFPAIAGTKDIFGFKNHFQDDVSNKTIDNWKSWEKAGYRKPLDVTRNHDVKEKIKRKIDKIKHDKNKGV